VICNDAERRRYQVLCDLYRVPGRRPRGDSANLDRALALMAVGRIWNGMVHELVHAKALQDARRAPAPAPAGLRAVSTS
jgi:hypothetical protein